MVLTAIFAFRPVERNWKAKPLSFQRQNPNQLSSTVWHIFHPVVERQSRSPPQGGDMFVTLAWGCTAARSMLKSWLGLHPSLLIWWTTDLCIRLNFEPSRHPIRTLALMDILLNIFISQPHSWKEIIPFPIKEKWGGNEDTKTSRH